MRVSFFILLNIIAFSCNESVSETINEETFVEKQTVEKVIKIEESEFIYNPNQELSNKPQEYDGFIFLFNDHNIKQKDEVNLNGISGDFSLNASNKQLTATDVENLYKGDLEIIRNTIYARHGYIFKNKKMKYFFEELIQWYQPVSDDVSKEITDLEYKNIDLIKRYEENARKFMPSFAR